MNIFMLIAVDKIKLGNVYLTMSSASSSILHCETTVESRVHVGKPYHCPLMQVRFLKFAKNTSYLPLHSTNRQFVSGMLIILKMIFYTCCSLQTCLDCCIQKVIRKIHRQRKYTRN